MEEDAFLRPRARSDAYQTPLEETQKDSSFAGSERPLASSNPSSATLQRSFSFLWIVAFYAAISVVSWVLLCFLTERPLTAKTYAYLSTAYLQWKGSNGYSPEAVAASERWYQAMRVLQSIAGVLTIPITSAVCSKAAAAYAQYNKRRAGMTMRQSMTLADRGWTDPHTYLRVFGTWTGLRRYGNTFPVFAVILNLLGGIIQPLQQVFLTQTSIKTPIYRQQLYRLTDIDDLFRFAPDQDDGSVVLMTRDALATTSAIEPMIQLWQGAGFTCDSAALEANDTAADGSWIAPPSACGYGATLGNYSALQDPFLAQLPSTFQAGVIRQFLPRFNSSATYKHISNDLYPLNCGEREGGYFVRYENDGDENPWAVEVCMPADLRQPPWERTRVRQDFGEELFINVSRTDAGAAPEQGGSSFHITLNTTAEYFELPNYMISSLPGPLLHEDPNDICDVHCESQGLGLDEYTDIYDHDNPYGTWKKRQANPDAKYLEYLPSKGPLLTIAMALFGEGSFISDRVSYPDKYLMASNSTLANGTCVDFAPLQFLRTVNYGYEDWSEGNQCVINNATTSLAELNGGISLWLRNFQQTEAATMENAFNAAAFLATKAWLENQISVPARTLTVNFDLGTDTQVPAISPAGMYVISILLAIFLISLFAMALWSSWQPRWTSQLDAFAMMRIGAAQADIVPLLLSKNPGKVDALDRIPGWIGDENWHSNTDADIGKLGIGAHGALRRGRRYHCYEGDHKERPRLFDGQREEYMSIRMQQLKDTWNNGA